MDAQINQSTLTSTGSSTWRKSVDRFAVLLGAIGCLIGLVLAVSLYYPPLGRLVEQVVVQPRN